MADEKKFEVPGMVSIVPTDKKTEQRKEAFESAVESPTLSTGLTVAEIVDRYSRLLYVVDASGSMGEGMLQEDRANQYLWSDNTLLKFRQALAEIGEEEVEADAEFVDDEFSSAGPEFTSMTDEELKNKVVDEKLYDRFNIPLRRNLAYTPNGRSKMMAVKDAAREFVTQRFKRFPDALVSLYSFEGEYEQKLLSSGASEVDVLKGIDKLPDHGGGGTHIYAAVSRAMRDIKAQPSKVNRHHIVLVSDGCDYGARNVESLVPEMKERGVVFDFIYIVGVRGGEAIDPDVLASLKRVCEMTGGEFQTVTTEKDFQQKFLAASNRKMLPAVCGK